MLPTRMCGIRRHCGMGRRDPSVVTVSVRVHATAVAGHVQPSRTFKQEAFRGYVARSPQTLQYAECSYCDGAASTAAAPFIKLNGLAGFRVGYYLTPFNHVTRSRDAGMAIPNCDIVSVVSTRPVPTSTNVTVERWWTPRSRKATVLSSGDHAKLAICVRLWIIERAPAPFGCATHNRSLPALFVTYASLPDIGPLSPRRLFFANTRT